MTVSHQRSTFLQGAYQQIVRDLALPEGTIATGFTVDPEVCNKVHAEICVIEIV